MPKNVKNDFLKNIFRKMNRTYLPNGGRVGGIERGHMQGRGSYPQLVTMHDLSEVP